MLDHRLHGHTLLAPCSSPRARPCHRLYVFRLAVAIGMTAALAGPCFADGPPPRSLVQPDSLGDATPMSAGEAHSDTSAALARIEGASYRETRPPGGTHGTLRRVALASAIGLAAAALWRETVAEDRENDYERAIVASSAVDYREAVRDAEQERNVLAILSAVGLSVVVWTFVY
jgi:hypothetical protein